MPILLKPSQFQEEVLQSPIPVVVDFFGERCMPCRMLRPILVELSEELVGKVKFFMLSTDREPEESDAAYEEKFKLIYEYNIMNLPTLLLFLDGKLKETLIGLHDKEELRAAFASAGFFPVEQRQEELPELK